MKGKFYHLLFCNSLLLLSYSMAFTQPGDLTVDALYFEKQAQLYDSWLEREGIGKHLKYRELKVKPDHLSLYLEFNYQELDSMINAWKQMKRSFEAQNGITFEEHLFYKLNVLMEVRQSLLDIQVYNTYDLRKEPLFFRGVYFDDGQVKVQTSDPKSEIRTFVLSDAQLKKGSASSGMELNSSTDKEGLFNRIIALSKEKYTQATCPGRKPSFKVLEVDKNLRFRIQDLCKVVLTEESQPLLCALGRRLGFNCNHITREMLVITVSFQKLQSGAEIELNIEGKFGSGLYDQVARGAYHDMEHEPKFKPYLVEFADDLRNYLKQEL